MNLDRWTVDGCDYSLVVHRDSDVGAVRRHRKTDDEPVKVASVDYAEGVVVTWNEKYRHRAELWLVTQERRIEPLVRAWRAGQ